VNRLLLLIPLFFSVSAEAQPQVVNFKELQQFLPQGNLGTYVRGKTDGETSTMMGFTTSWSQVTYSSSSDSCRCTVSIKITDMLNIPSYMSIAPSTSGSSGLQVVSGYRKTVVYNNLSVVETFDSTSHQAKLQVTLATRFLVEIIGEGISNPMTLYSFLDKTDLDGLKRIAQGGTSNQRK